MSYYFRAVAVDYDGTLVMGLRPEPLVLEALKEVRQSGRKLILVTGRTFIDLRADFGDVNDYFDAIVAENGAVLWRPGSATRLLAAPVDPALCEALLSRSVPVQQGEVLLASLAHYGASILEAIGRLGLDCQILANRGALMVLPAGVSKGAGLLHALREFGLSCHSCLAIGDAENDHSLLDACEVGVATSNAIDSLKAHADVILSEPGGEGIARFLRGGVLQGIVRVEPKRWRVEIGTSTDGFPMTIPASRVNLLIAGGSGTGKSYLAGLIAEQLITLGYTLCIFDLEGDHVSLAQLAGVVVVGGGIPLPPAAHLGQLLQQGLGSVVVNLSLETEGTKRSYTREAVCHLQCLRKRTGLPHWLFMEEAHVYDSVLACEDWLDMDQTGYCLVTYLPEQLSNNAVLEADILISLSKDDAILQRRGDTRTQSFTLGPRDTTHFRHHHKYSERLLPEDRRFYFRNIHDRVEATAGNLAQLNELLHHISDEVIRHHACGRDFSRWIRDVLRDSRLAHGVRAIEEKVAASSLTQTLSSLRSELIQLIGNPKGAWPQRTS